MAIIGTPILSVKTLDDEKYKNILNYKDKLSHKILTIKYNEETQKYNIISCKYEDTKIEDTIATYYRKMQDTFEIWNIDYDYDEIYTSSEVLVENFDELSSIYTENALRTYKEEMGLFVYKNNGEVYITAGDMNIADYIFKIEFKNITNSSTSISCDVVRTFRRSFVPEDEEYNEIYTKTDKFTIIKDSSKGFLVDEFNYNNT